MELVISNQRIRNVAERSLDPLLICDESLRVLRLGQVQISAKTTASENGLNDLCAMDQVPTCVGYVPGNAELRPNEPPPDPVSLDPTKKGKKAGTVALQAPTGNLSLSIGLCTFVYEEPREAKPVVWAEAEDTTVSALSVFFRSNEVFVFYELREPLGKTSLPGWSTI